MHMSAKEDASINALGKAAGVYTYQELVRRSVPQKILSHCKFFSSTVSQNRLPSTSILSPQHSTSRSLPLLSLNNTDSTNQTSNPESSWNDASSPFKRARLDFLMDMMVSLDPTMGSPELLSTYPDGINDTISISLSSIVYKRGITSTSSTQETLSVDLPDHDVPIPSIEFCDADHPSAEETPIAAYGFDWMTWEEYTSCDFNTLEKWL
ncbi:uncharacterized protein EAF02_008587 [Botrytis sinoallii]|uniref:uncharacterized protein n=1 Tax=Botrytis sinoallii TaxID=1463999 RepID=UPI001900322A|nr:uncharacterized protein EAF02_008587 [Botrytis sinoallii]KAF7874610.1 hypothetical protein EAF02_008587 [Botrytis sinoallii]